MKLSWDWLKNYVTVSKSPQAAAEALTMAGLEVKQIKKAGRDFFLETEITPNRPDWLSHIGVAREIAACCHGVFKKPLIRHDRLPLSASKLIVQTPDVKWCPYYSGIVIEGIQCGKTPDWMCRRLAVCGIRSISLLVDISNYVLLECGQPLHVFDLDRLRGNKITARHAESGEKIQAIDGKEYDLTPDDCVIADAAGPVAIGGIMGGEFSAVNPQTKNILVESAYFIPAMTRKTSRRLKLMSESSYRFERGVDPVGVDFARDRAAAFILRLAHIKKISRVKRSGKLPVRNQKLILPEKEIKKTLGISIPTRAAKLILSRLGFGVRFRQKKFFCKIPSFRSDLMGPADLIEEIARIYGYHKIPESLPVAPIKAPAINPLSILSDRCRDLSFGLGFREVVTYSLIDPVKQRLVDPDETSWVHIRNPRNASLTLMRPSLAVNFLDTICHNLNAGAESVMIFEIGNRYLQQKTQLPNEERRIAFGMAGGKTKSWIDSSGSFTFYHLKGMITALLERLHVSFSLATLSDKPMMANGQGVSITAAHQIIGYFGTLTPSLCRTFEIQKTVFYGELSLQKLVQMKKRVIQFVPITRFPGIERDLAVLVDKHIPCADLQTAIRRAGENRIRHIDIFDVYLGKHLPHNKKSIAFRIRYQSPDRTLETEEINRLHFSIVDQLTKQFGAMLPSKKNDTEPHA